MSFRPSILLHITLATAVSLALASGQALAHEVWIEDTPAGQLVVRFAEFGEGFEKSPGHLDSLTQPVAFTPDAETVIRKLAVQKNSDHFLLQGADPRQSAQIETGFEIMNGREKAETKETKPGRKPFFYARWHGQGAEAVKPALNFDLVPTGKPGEVCVYFRGKPLPDMEVTAHLPDGKEQELKSDKDGLVLVSVDKPGLYMLNCKRKREDVFGFEGGRAYEAISHNCSVAWRQPAK